MLRDSGTRQLLRETRVVGPNSHHRNRSGRRRLQRRCRLPVGALRGDSVRGYVLLDSSIGYGMLSRHDVRIRYLSGPIVRRSLHRVLRLGGRHRREREYVHEQ